MDTIKNWFAALTTQQRRVLGFAAAGTALLAGIWLSNNQNTSSDSVGEAPLIELSTTVRVHVVGEVAAPGLYELPVGAIANDAIAIAGGLLPTAAEQSINLARVLVDGEQLMVLSESQLTTSESGMLSLNRATEEQLQALPGIGPALAKRIVEYRSANGAFSTIEELTSVSGIGPKLFAAIRDQLTL